MTDYTYRIKSRNLGLYRLDGYMGTCPIEVWEHGPGIFHESCKRDSIRAKKLIAIKFNGEEYEVYGMVEKLPF